MFNCILSVGLMVFFDWRRERVDLTVLRIEGGMMVSYFQMIDILSQSWCRCLYISRKSPSSENADSDSHVASEIGYTFNFT